MNYTLEVAIHQYLQEDEKTLEWLKRFLSEKEAKKILKKALYKDFLYYKGGKIVEVITNRQFKY